MEDPVYCDSSENLEKSSDLKKIVAERLTKTYKEVKLN